MSTVGSTDVSLIKLERSYHVATLDHDADQIFDTTAAFFHRLVKN
jgi:carboxylesterase